MSEDPAGGWGLNIGGFIAHYRPRGWLVTGRGSGSGWQAVHLDGNGSRAASRWNHSASTTWRADPRPARRTRQ